MVGCCVKRSRHGIDYVQSNRFSSADIDIFFLFFICGIQLTYLSCLERNVVTYTFLLPNISYKSYKLFYRFFPIQLGSIFSSIAGLVAFFKMANRFPFFRSSFSWICARFSPSIKLNYLAPLLIFKRGKVSSFRRKISCSQL